MSKKDEEKIAKHLALFDGPDAQKKVLSHAKRYALCEKAQVKIFGLPNAMDVLRAYIQHDSLCDKAELKMVAHPDAKKFLREYIREYSLCDKAEAAMVRLPDVAELVLDYVKLKDDVLGDEADKLIFSLPNAKTILNVRFDKELCLSNEAEAMLVNLPDNFELFEKYVSNYKLGKPGRKALLERKDNKKYLLCYVENYYSFDLDEFFVLMEHPDADEIIEAYKYQCDDWIKEYNKRKKKS